jgi:hypothetical protein
MEPRDKRQEPQPLAADDFTSAARAGWEADARRLHAAGDDHLAWPEIANDADKGLRWAKR